MTRRKFLINGSTALATLAAPGGLGIARALGEKKERSLADLDYSQFAQLLHSSFRVAAQPAAVIELQLVEARLVSTPVRYGGQRCLDADYEKFSLIFTGRRDQFLEQNTYQLEHDQLGSFGLFMVPIRSCRTDRFEYLALFNRPQPPLNHQMTG